MTRRPSALNFIPNINQLHHLEKSFGQTKQKMTKAEKDQFAEQVYKTVFDQFGNLRNDP